MIGSSIASSPERTLLKDAHLVDIRGETPDGWVLFEGASIVAVGEARATPPPAHHVHELGGRHLVPGFVDIHVHGGGGTDAEDGIDGMRTALEAHRRHGTTRSVLSFVTSGLVAMQDALAGFAELAESDPLILGAHLEGPFLAPERCGAHDPALLRLPDARSIAALLEASEGRLAQLTLAPELPGADAAIDTLVANGVRVAIGHSDADYATARRAFDRGASILTHAFNGMRGIGHRAPGPVVAALDSGHATLELILDGHHVDPRVAHLVFAAADGRVALVSDAMAAADAEDGDYRLGELTVRVDQGVARLTTTGGLAGSTLTLDAALRTAREELALDWPAAVGALTAVPARALGHETRLGLLAPGYAADAVVLGPGLDVEAVWADGTRIR